MNKQLLYATIASLLFPAATTFGMNNYWGTVRRNQRRIEAHTIKSAVSDFDERKPVPVQPSNGDEQRYSDKRGSFNKSLNHKDNGFPDPAAFASMVHALETGNPTDFNNIQLGGTTHLVNPQASLTYSLAANDGWINPVPAAPTFASAETAGEMVEDYWSALLRDVPFNMFATNPTAIAAAADLSLLSDFKGPKMNGIVTAGTLLRGNTAGDLVGPYISQFLYLTIPWGSTNIGPDQFVPTATAGNDFMTNFTDWFTVINGGSTGQTLTIDPTKHFIRTPRDIGEYVHKDFPCTGGIAAALILNSFGQAAVDPANPYFNNPTQDAFVMFGISELITLVQEASHEVMKSTWYQKWQIQRRLRPEEFGFYLDYQLMNGVDLGINADVLNSAALPAIFAAFGSYFLPIAYPEGCPSHPAYNAGHASFIGASVTILKAWFNEDFVIPSPVMPDAANTALVPYVGTLTIGDELNKLASNIAVGRNMAGVHWRSDGWQGMLLGEKVAIDLLNNRSYLFNENFAGFTLTTFEGNRITVGRKRTP